MRELTGQRIAMGALLVCLDNPFVSSLSACSNDAIQNTAQALLINVICSWHEKDTTKVMTMLTLHGQTSRPKWAKFSVDVARSSVIPTLFSYNRTNGTVNILSLNYELSSSDIADLRQREILSVEVVQAGSDVYTSGLFDNRAVTVDSAQVELVTTIMILLIWILGVASFASPVMTLVSEVETVSHDFLNVHADMTTVFFFVCVL